MLPFRRFFLWLGFSSLLLTASAQLPYDDEVCVDKTPAQLKSELQKQRFVHGLNKTLIYLSYLAYRDRSVDRPLSGVDEYEPYRGKKIGCVQVVILDPYGVSIEEPEGDRQTRLQKFANRVQIKTKEWVVRNDLLFKDGDTVDPVLIADTERNLWKRETFKDLKIFMLPVEGSDDVVDMVVMLQDKWTWGLMTSLEYNRIVAGFEMKNFIGLPMSLANFVSFNYRKDNFYSVYGYYLYQNIKRTQIATELTYKYDNFGISGSVGVVRPFVSANQKWAGHVKGGVDRQYKYAPNPLAEAITTNTFTNWQDVWLAYAFKAGGNFFSKRDLLRWIVSGRMYRMHYLKRPFLRSADGALNFLDRTYFLGSFGFANWDYYVDHSVYHLGAAEYFSKGLNAAIIVGFDYDEELEKRFYSGFKIDYGKYIAKAGYFNTRLSYGGFTKKDTYQQILLRWSNTFYTSPVKLGNRFMMRQFITAGVNLGFNRPLGKELVVNNSNGVRGIFIDYIRGARSYVFNFETDVYPTFKILGFASSVFAFADIAIMQKNSLYGYTLGQGYGGGIRLRNLALGIGFFEISFTYYPKLEIPDLRPYTFMGGFENKRALKPNNLFVPGVLTPE